MNRMRESRTNEAIAARVDGNEQKGAPARLRTRQKPHLNAGMVIAINGVRKINDGRNETFGFYEALVNVSHVHSPTQYTDTLALSLTIPGWMVIERVPLQA